MAFMNYKRSKPFNTAKDKHIKKLELHLKKIEYLRNGNTNQGTDRDSM